jgi:Na+-driven multidrug efflux pump
VLRWHALTNLFVFLGVAQTVTIVNDRQSHISLIKTICGAAVSVALNFALVPKWGAIGAAWAAIGSYFAAAVLSNIFIAPTAFSMQLKAFWPFHAQRA